MNEIRKSPVASLGYHFIPGDCLPRGKDEYYLRNQQNKNGIEYRQLSAYEIEVLVRNRNTSDNWNNLLVSNAFTAELVQDCKFFGLVRIGKLEPYYLEFHNLRRPVGFYNSTIISSDFGDNVVIDNVNYLSHYIVGNDVMIVNTNEVATTDNAKFGNGILKQKEPESRRIWLEVCNENGGRNIIPFDGMLPGDAWLWSRFRSDVALQQKLREFTEKKFDDRRGYYGKIGDRTVIKNCKIIKDVLIGSDAYLKGANKLKNLTINSAADEKTQIGEGCELVNGIIGYGCRIFYGVKAVRFILASHSQLKYGARLINSYLGSNSTISCCEVLNSLIFPAHEQHHNNSFLCAALVMGQSNMAAGATIGSNHNSRSPDGELVAGRGFWPGLCVSLKHNSKFGSFIILAKGDYPAELSIPIPFSLVSNDVSRDELMVMPAYWFLHNMYALARNSWKYQDRDKRTDKTQLLEYDFLAPDSVNEMIRSLELFRGFAAKAYISKFEITEKYTDEQLLNLGKKILEGNKSFVDDLEIFADHFEHSKRKVRIIKIFQAYQLFKELISYYVVSQLLQTARTNRVKNLNDLKELIPARLSSSAWVNMGGQLVQETSLQKLIQQIRSGKIKEWDQVHQFYQAQATSYPHDKWVNSLLALKEVHGLDMRKIEPAQLKNLLLQSVSTREWITKGIYDSRAKDYTNPFRKMVYDSFEEMTQVTGSLEENSFIKQEIEALGVFKKEIRELAKKFKL
jgi:NDP-sugar pyrophosphorylase family protein